MALTLLAARERARVRAQYLPDLKAFYEGWLGRELP